MDAEARAELKETFDFFDADNNGVIDQAEFVKLLDALGAGMDEEEIAVGFDIIDDDDNGHIEFDEFLAWWADGN